MREWPRGTILVPKSGASTLLNRRARLAVPAYVSSHLATVIARPGICSRFLFFVLCQVDARMLLDGVDYPSLSVQRLKGVPVLIPTSTTQRAITQYLDRTTADIDTTIDSGYQQIGLLEERRRVIVSRVVAQGLEAEVRLRASGVPQIGDIPEHWEVRRLKRCSQLVMGQSPAGWECGPLPGRPFLQGCAEFGARHPVPEQSCERPPKVAPQGSILLSVRAPVGRLNRANTEYGIGRGLCAILPYPEDLQTDFAYYQLEALQEGLLAKATGSTYGAVSVSDIGNHTVVLPPRAEQARIVSHLDRVTADLNSAVACVRREIKLLREYRAKLIADAVTGRFDVHESASQSPEWHCGEES